MILNTFNFDGINGKNNAVKLYFKCKRFFISDRFPNFVREQILLVVAVIFKLGTLESPDARTALINGLNSLLTTGNKTMVTLHIYSDLLQAKMPSFQIYS